MAQKTKKIGSGESLTASQFAYVGDPDKVSTWKFPIHDKEHVQNAVARFNQTTLTGDAKASAKRKIKAAYKKFFPDNEIPEVIKSMEIDKATMNDKRRMLSDALDSGWVLDFDEEFVYFEQWDNVAERYVAFRKTYEISDGNVVTFGQERKQRITRYRLNKNININF